MSSKWHESIGEERRQADLTAQALGQQDETCAETDAELTPGGKHHQHGKDIREFAREVSTALIEPQREPNTDLRKKIQQHFDEQNPSHTRRYAEMTSNKTTSQKSKTLWFVLAACAFVAAAPLVMDWYTDHRQSQSVVSVTDNTAREAASVGKDMLVLEEIK